MGTSLSKIVDIKLSVHDTCQWNNLQQVGSKKKYLEAKKKKNKAFGNNK